MGLLREQFPGAVLWFGHHTGRFWALVRLPGFWRLVEAITPEELALALREPWAWPWPPPR
ncbi:hypothetical protein [Spirillospora sp. NPDC029432]|uniref:hypothetical protein n=1 Tax=Spirillospora sp. NPDC029432 TaxID=3154599 RepID=UPI003452764F